MEDENYKAILEKFKSYDKQIEDMQKRLDDTLAFNRQLLNTRDTSTAEETESKERYQKELQAKLDRAFKGE